MGKIDRLLYSVKMLIEDNEAAVYMIDNGNFIMALGLDPEQYAVPLSDGRTGYDVVKALNDTAAADWDNWDNALGDDPDEFPKKEKPMSAMIKKINALIELVKDKPLEVFARTKTGELVTVTLRECLKNDDLEFERVASGNNLEDLDRLLESIREMAFLEDDREPEPVLPDIKEISLQEAADGPEGIPLPEAITALRCLTRAETEEMLEDDPVIIDGEPRFISYDELKAIADERKPEQKPRKLFGWG